MTRCQVHVLENNEGLLMRDFATNKPFYDKFEIKVWPHRPGHRTVDCASSRQNTCVDARSVAIILPCMEHKR
eukprot:6192740-Pleurochrysis_carterae.AAC.1